MTNLKEIMYNVVASVGILAGCAGALNYFIEYNKRKDPSAGYLFTSIALMSNSALMLPNKKGRKLEEKLEEKQWQTKQKNRACGIIL